MRFLAERTQFRRDRVVVPIARKHFCRTRCFSAVFSAGGACGGARRRSSAVGSSVPGIRDIGAQVIVSEIGTDMSRFPSEGHLISWAGLCPRNDQSAGKRRSNRLRKGAPWLKTTLVQCAWAARRRSRLLSPKSAVRHQGALTSSRLLKSQSHLD
jgi:transposase